MNSKQKIALLFTCSMLVFQLIYGQTSTLVSVGTNGKLVYTPDSKGNVVPDFSGVGYMNSEAPIPTIAVVKTVYPVVGDNLANVQSVIDSVSAMPLDANGFRGAILFKSGVYNISDTIHISASGIVLRGEGFDTSGTHFVATKPAQHTLFYFKGNAGTSTVSGTKKAITDVYVPFGTKQVTVAAGHSFQPGNQVFLHRIPNQLWIDMLTMTQWGWTPSAYDVYYERIVTAVNGNQITLDAPVMDLIDTTYAKGELVKFTSSRIENCGIENMWISSYYASATDNNHGWDAIEFENIKNAWARNLEVYFFGHAAVHTDSHASWVTVDSCKCLDGKSTLNGGERYSFNLDGQRCLVQNCFTRNGRHDYVNGSQTAGPNVFYNCQATQQQADIGPHHRWATGILFDNIVGNGAFAVQNRTNSGTGHGWAGAQIMFWNCEGNRLILQDPEGDHTNWCIGYLGWVTGIGDLVTEPLGIVESTGTHIAAIPSLFMAQLNDRLITLPLESISFEAKKYLQITSLKWSSNTANSGSIFFIEHSQNGTNFQTIGQVEANVITGLSGSYTFQHNEPSFGQNYYRIKQVDVSGKVLYSATRLIVFGKNNLSLKSNLVKDVLDVLNAGNTTVINIFNTAGIKVLATKISGNQTIDVSSFTSGLYLIQSDENETIKFIKQ